MPSFLHFFFPLRLSPVSGIRNPVSHRQRFGTLVALLLLAAASASADPAQLAAARALFHERGKSAEAQQAFETIAAADPRSFEAHLHLGQLALRRDDTEKAIEHLQQALDLEPRHSEAHRHIGDAFGRSAQKASVFKQLGFAKKCLAAYEKAVELDPANVAAHQSLFEYYRQAPGFAGGSRDKALAQAATIKRLDPLRGRIAFATLHTADKKYELALAEFEEALRANPDDYSAHYQIGRLAATSGQFVERGIAALRRCLELAPPPGTPGRAAVHWRLGNLHEKAGNTAAARTAYEASLSADPSFTAATEALRKMK